MSSSSLSAEQVRGPAQMSDARLVAHQLRYDLLGVWRDPQSRFFTIVLPLIFLVLLTSLFGNHTVHVHGHAIKNSTYYVPGISTLGIIATSFVNLVITITGQRESGVLKRRRSTPVPAWVLIASRALTSVILASAMVAVIVAIGRIVYGVQLPSSTLPAFVLGVIVGAAASAACPSRRRASSATRTQRSRSSRRSSCRSTSSRACSSPRTSCRARCATSRACSPSATSTTRSSRRSIRPRPARASPRPTC